MNRLKYITSAAAALALALTAHALPSPGLTISSGSSTVFVALNNFAPGVTLFTGSIGSWSLTVDTGSAYPQIGSATSPAMDLGFVESGVGTGSNALTVDFVDAFGPLSAGSGVANINGNALGGLSYTYQVLQSINGGSTYTPVTAVSSGFNATLGGPTLGGASVDFDQHLVFSGATGGSLESGDANFTVPDQGMTMVLLGLGLSALSLVAFKRNKVQASA